PSSTSGHHSLTELLPLAGSPRPALHRLARPACHPLAPLPFYADSQGRRLWIEPRAAISSRKNRRPLAPPPHPFRPTASCPSPSRLCHRQSFAEAARDSAHLSHGLGAPTIASVFPSRERQRRCPHPLVAGRLCCLSAYLKPRVRR
ncbi:hypothetical protein U9M48_031949, partial [Paspalum notatum var. saurae]